jgi:predicted secreted protein
MACINGTKFLVYVEGSPIAYSTSATLNINTDLPSCASKDSGGWEEVMHGLRDWSIDVDGLVQFDNYFAADDLVKLLLNRTAVTVKFATTDTGDTYWEGEAKLQSDSITADMEQPTTQSVTFIGSGALTEMTV